MLEHQPLIAYCTNVLAGNSWSEMKDNVTRCAADVRRIVDPDRPLALGLWLSAATAREIRAAGTTAAVRAWLDDAGLRCVTLNGFPYGDFHGAVVKHQVYQPAWDDVRRRDYTLDLAHILAAILPADAHASISTLPVGWGAHDLTRAAGMLCTVAEQLADIAASTGRHITVDLEPEPGCLLQTSADVVRFFDDHLADYREHIGVCHDICHAAVMFEDQAEVIERYARAGIRVGKVQVSSAIGVDFDTCAISERSQARIDLTRFAEPRYLHQTTVRDARGMLRFHADLAVALAAEADAGHWRVHFHVPIYHEQIGELTTTAADIPRALAALPVLPVLEIETYAWSVLPAAQRAVPLVEGMAREIQWLQTLLERGLP